LREWSWDPLMALLYRPLNDPLQIYLAYRSLYSVVTGHPIRWAKVPRVGDPFPRSAVGPSAAVEQEKLAAAYAGDEHPVLVSGGHRTP
jgi:hypothetical protein